MRKRWPLLVLAPLGAIPAFMTPPAPAPARVAVLLCAYPDIAPAPYGATAVDSAFVGVDAYFEEVSRGRLDITWQTFGWLTLPRTSSEYHAYDQPYVDLPRLLVDCIATAGTQLDASLYDWFAVVSNGWVGTGAPGFASISPVDSTGTVYRRVTATNVDGGAVARFHVHELGHVIGWPHTLAAQGYHFDVMHNGPELKRTTVFNRINAGWLDPSEIAYSSAAEDTFDLVSLEQAGTHALLLPVAPEVAGYIAVEARNPDGVDGSWLTDPVVLVTRVDSAVAYHRTFLENIGFVGGLQRGATVRDSTTGIEVTWVSEPGVPFRIAVRRPRPTLHVSATTFHTWAIPGLLDFPRDSVRVSTIGPSQGVSWSAAEHSPYLSLLSNAGSAGDWLQWARDTAAVNAAYPYAGRIVDTVEISLPGATNATVRIIDTLSWGARHDVQIWNGFHAAGNAPQRSTHCICDTAAVLELLRPVVRVPVGFVNFYYPGYDPAELRDWRVTIDHSAPWVAPANDTLYVPGGNIPGNAFTWSQDIRSLAEGIGVDTITVLASDSPPLVVYDTIEIQSALSVSVAPKGRSVSVLLGDAAPNDSSDIAYTGFTSDTVRWSATVGTSGSWIRIVNPAGAGTGQLRWRRDATGMGLGVYVDSIRVSTLSGRVPPQTIVDTLRIWAPLSLMLSQSTNSDTVTFGIQREIFDSVLVQVAGTDATSTAWNATHSASASWATLSANQGIGTGWFRWTKRTSGMPIGAHVDTVSVTAPGVAGSPAIFVDTLRITPIPFTLEQALAAALGDAFLLSAHEAYLDEIGNKNGVFDVGDLLALFDVTGTGLTSDSVAHPTPSRGPGQ
jgi:M6 family metalloprotease-like protein